MAAEFGIADPLHPVKLGVADGSGWAADLSCSCDFLVLAIVFWNGRRAASRIMLKHNAARIERNAAEPILLIINTMRRRTRRIASLLAAIGAAPSSGPIKKT